MPVRAAGSGQRRSRFGADGHGRGAPAVGYRRGPGLRGFPGGKQGFPFTSWSFQWWLLEGPKKEETVDTWSYKGSHGCGQCFVVVVVVFWGGGGHERRCSKTCTFLSRLPVPTCLMKPEGSLRQAGRNSKRRPASGSGRKTLGIGANQLLLPLYW